MHRVLLILTLLVGQVLAKDKIAASRKGSKKALTAQEIRSIYKAIPDGDLIQELTDLGNQRAQLGHGEFEALYRHGLDQELVERGRKDKAFGKILVGHLAQTGMSRDIKRSIVKHFWKFRQEAEEVTEDEKSLRRLYAETGDDRDLKSELIKSLNTTSPENIDFLMEITRKTTDPEELRASVTKLGRLGRKSGKERDQTKVEKIQSHLKGLKSQKRITLTHLSVADVFTENKQGRDYLKSELEKDDYENWQAVAFAIKEDLGYDHLRKAYRRSKADGSMANDERVLRQLARTNMRDFRKAKAFENSQAKTDFLEIRVLANDGEATPESDAALVDLLADKDESVRYAAVVSAHNSLKDNLQVLSELYKSEKSEKIRQFLHSYGYAE